MNDWCHLGCLLIYSIVSGLGLSLHVANLGDDRWLHVHLVRVAGRLSRNIGIRVLLLDWLVIIHGLLVGLWLTSNHLSLHLFYGRSVNRRHAVIQLVNADNVLRRLTVAH